MTMKCPKCKSEIRDDALFCSECGTKIEKETTMNSRVAKREQQKQSQNKKTVTIVAIVALIVIIVIGCYFLFFKGDQSSEEKQSTTEKTETTTKKIKLEKTKLTIKVGETEYIEANMDCQYKVKDTSICEVDSFGTVKGLKEGTTTVTCTADNKTQATCQIKVEKGQETTTTGDYIFPNSSTQLLTEADLTGKSEWDLRIAINEIYARHHCTFKTKEIADYFASKSWYSADPNLTSDKMNADVKAYLNDIEVKNVNFIRTYQQSH